jgi:hypothetical protein
MSGAVVNAYSLAAAEYDILGEIAWVHAYYAEGPNYLAQGYADAASITTLPDEAGSADLTVAKPTKPTHADSSSDMNNNPAFNFTGGGIQTATAWTGVTQIYETIMVAVGIPDAVNQQYWFDAHGSTDLRLYTSGSSSEMTIGLGGNTQRWNIGVTAAVETWGAKGDGTSTRVYQNGVDEFGHSNASTAAFRGLTLGADQAGANPGVGHVAFWGIKDSAFTTGERADIQDWASTKYGA